MAKTNKKKTAAKAETSRGLPKKSFRQEFKEFITRGNVIELAVGLTVGAAFTQLIKSLVENIVMPPIGLLLSGVAFSDLFISLNGRYYQSLADAEAAGAPVLRYGRFFSDLLNFLIIALVIFFVIKSVSMLRAKGTGIIKHGRSTKEAR